MTNSDAIAIIPARAGSKGLPNKNVRNLCGKPLFMYSVQAALDAGLSRVFISTDIPEILNCDLPVGVEALPRPRHLCADDTTMAAVVMEFLTNSFTGPGTIVLLQPTSPLRTSSHVNAALKVFHDGTCSLAMSVCEANPSVQKWGRLSGKRFLPISNPEHCFANRQSLPPIYRPNGAVYVFDAQTFRSNRDFSATSICAIEMSVRESLDIDSLDDFCECEKLLNQELRNEN